MGTLSTPSKPSCGTAGEYNSPLGFISQVTTSSCCHQMTWLVNLPALCVQTLALRALMEEQIQTYML